MNDDCRAVGLNERILPLTERDARIEDFHFQGSVRLNGHVPHVAGVRSVRILETVLLPFGVEVTLRCLEVRGIAFPRRVKMETMRSGRKLGGVDDNLYAFSGLRALHRTDL